MKLMGMNDGENVKNLNIYKVSWYPCESRKMFVTFLLILAPPPRPKLLCWDKCNIWKTMFVIKSVSVCMSKKMSTFLHCVRARFEVSQGPPVSNEKVSVCHKLSSLFLSSVGTAT